MRGLCKKCGSLIPEGATACADCGTPVAASSATHCSKCGYVLLPGLTFCPSCGTSAAPPEANPASATSN